MMKFFFGTFNTPNLVDIRNYLRSIGYQADIWAYPHKYGYDLDRNLARDDTWGALEQYDVLFLNTYLIHGQESQPGPFFYDGLRNLGKPIVLMFMGCDGRDSEQEMTCRRCFQSNSCWGKTQRTLAMIERFNPCLIWWGTGAHWTFGYLKKCIDVPIVETVPPVTPVEFIKDQELWDYKEPINIVFSASSLELKGAQVGYWLVQDILAELQGRPIASKMEQRFIEYGVNVHIAHQLTHEDNKNLLKSADFVFANMMLGNEQAGATDLIARMQGAVNYLAPEDYPFKIHKMEQIIRKLLFNPPSLKERKEIAARIRERVQPAAVWAELMQYLPITVP